MMFCPKCKCIMMPKASGKKTVLACSCGHVHEANVSFTEQTKKRKEIEVIEERESLPIIEQECPKCHHKKAFFWSKQTRAADEPETRFFKCEECKHTWRDYK